jgi:hypothetical protein
MTNNKSRGGRVVTLSTPIWGDTAGADKARSGGKAPRITVVNDEACPRCGAFWGNPNPELDFPNRPKVDNDWKCYNPNCTCGYYRNGRVLENKPSPERLEEIRAEAQARVAEMMKGRVWAQVEGNAWQLKPPAEVREDGRWIGYDGPVTKG